MLSRRTAVLSLALSSAIVVPFSAPSHAAGSPQPDATASSEVVDPRPAVPAGDGFIVDLSGEGVDRWKIDFQDKTSKYREAHPDDLVGLDRLQQSLGAGPMRITYPLVRSEPFSAAEAQRLVLKARLTQGGPAQDTGFRGLKGRAIASDAFTLSNELFGSISPDEKISRGNWNFRDNWSGGANPVDISDLQLSASCWVIGSVGWNAYDYNGNNRSNYVSLRDGGLNNTSVLNVTDQVSGFVIPTDHGSHINYLRRNGCGGTPIRTQYKYEANQQGSITSVSASFGFLGVGYSGLGASLQKGTQVNQI